MTRTVTLPLLPFSVNEAVRLRHSLFPQNIIQVFPTREESVTSAAPPAFFFVIASSLPVQLRLLFFTDRCGSSNPSTGGCCRARSAKLGAHTEHGNFCGTWHFASRINISSLVFSPFPSSCFMRSDVLLEVLLQGNEYYGMDL